MHANYNKCHLMKYWKFLFLPSKSVKQTGLDIGRIFCWPAWPLLLSILDWDVKLRRNLSDRKFEEWLDLMQNLDNKASNHMEYSLVWKGGTYKSFTCKSVKISLSPKNSKMGCWFIRSKSLRFLPGMRIKSNEDSSSLDRNRRWSPPNGVFWKLNSDAACSKEVSMTSLGMICRNFEGKVTVAASKALDVRLEAHIAELWAILEGLKLVISLGCTMLVVESDCQLAINFINKVSLIWSDSEAIVLSIWSLLPFF